MPDAPYRIETISRDNSRAAADFIYKIFGYTYTDTGLYDPEQILRYEHDGCYHMLVCMGPANTVHGMLLLAYSFPSRHMIEIGELLMDPDLSAASGGQILKQFIQLLRNQLMSLADHSGLRTVVSLEVTEHRLTQRLSLEMGFMTCGVYLGYIPGWQRQLRTVPQQREETPANPQCGSGDAGRRTMVVSARPFRSKTPRQQLSVPARFEQRIREIYKDYRLQCDFVMAPRCASSGHMESYVDFRRARAVVEVDRTGPETPDALLQQLKHFHAGYVELIHFVLPLSGHDIDPAVEALVGAGAGFGAVLPDYREGPVLVMQSIDRKCLAPISQGVLSPRAGEIVAELMHGAATLA